MTNSTIFVDDANNSIVYLALALIIISALRYFLAS